MTVWPIDGDKLRQLRTEAGLTQVQLAQKSGVPQTTISNVELNKTTRTSRQIADALAKALGVAVRELRREKASVAETKADYAAAGALPTEELARELLERLGVKFPDPEQRVRLIPRLNARVAAGFGGAPGDIPEREIETWVPGSPRFAGRRTASVLVSGDCLEPTLMPGDEVEFELGAEPADGDLIVALHEGELVVKLLQDGLLTSLKYPPIRPNGDTRVLGVVLRVERNLK